MSATDRIHRERIFHDCQARARAETFRQMPKELCFEDAAYLDHETWIRPAFEELGEVTNRRVLDFGCGHGMAAVVLSRWGAKVTAFDISSGYLEEARHRALANGASIDFVQTTGERLPFADDSFDHIWGHAILHHVDLANAACEICRILSPGGVAVFCEPWGGNALLSLARRGLPYPSKERSLDEAPLHWPHIRLLREIFPQVEMRGFQLLSMARRVLRPGRVTAGLDWCDELLLKRLPILQRFCRYAVLTLKKAI